MGKRNSFEKQALLPHKAVEIESEDIKGGSKMAKAKGLAHIGVFV